MKKLSMEEKARRYDEAITKGRQIQNTPYTAHWDTMKEVVEHLFPELKESEDEKIRKELIKLMKQMSNTIVEHYTTIEISAFVAWLEKQGEKINPYSGISFEYNGHIWGMCARDNGVDILLDKQLFKHLERGEQNQKHFELKAGHWYICHRAFCCRADHLTVKEGERFMCEKDGVIKGFVIKEPEKYFKEVCAPAPIEDEQKSTWSEEDLISLGYLATFVDKNGDSFYGKNKPNVVKWIRSFANLHTTQKQEWSEEDEKKIMWLVRLISTAGFRELDNDKMPCSRSELIDWLKSLRPQNT